MTTSAPRFNSFNALKPVRIPSHSGVTALLDTADEIHEKCSNADRLARDNAKLRERADALAQSYERLVEENAGLRCRIAELVAEDDAKAQTIGDLKAELELTTGRLIAAKDELESLRNQLDQVR